MIDRPSLRAIAGVGIDGDRYARGAGFWSYDPKFVDPITLVEREALDAVAAALGAPFGPRESRRNVVTEGIALERLIGARFRVGEVELEGVRPCDPCGYLDRLVGLPVRALLAGRGGLRAAIARGGTIAVGDAITLLSATPTPPALR